MHCPLFFFLSNLLLLFYFLPHNCIAYNDCLEQDESITTLDGSPNNTRISPGGIFELGFFTPHGSSDKRSKYFGIWYHNETNPRIVVWVANREKPISETNASLVLRDGVAKILGENGATYWSTNFVKKGRKLTTSLEVMKNFSAGTKIHPNPNNSTKPSEPSKHERRGISLCLEDGGNLILYDVKPNEKLWNMFDDNNLQSDTFLPGMELDGTLLNLTSWNSSNDPAQGMYTLQQNDNKLLITTRGSDYYWQSEATPFDYPVPPLVFNLLNSSLDNYSSSSIRLVVNFTGQVQLWTRERGRGWDLVWGEPRDKCDIDGICGVFASCNSNNGWRFCKCLPGFRPVSPEKWDLKKFSDGCEANSGSDSPAKRNDSENDSFLTLPMMNVRKPDESNEDQNSCRSKCLSDSRCLAYSCGVGVGGSHKKCMKWINPLTYLKEGYNAGITLFVRTTTSDIETTPRSCYPCGTYIIPYPLSTAKDCGDVSYSYFRCNNSTGQLSFLPHGSTFNVTSIDPDGKRFYIQAKHALKCDCRYMDSLVSPNNAKSKPPFKVRNCSVVMDQSFEDNWQSLVEVEVNWKPPPEPPCNQPSDCQGWLHTTCKDANGGQRRCLCGSKYRWDNSLLKCAKKPLPLKGVIASVAVAMLVILLCGIFVIYRIQKRKITRKQGSNEFKVEDVEGIDVPFFDWETILVATNNFADENELGKGGFGSVYKGTLPDGREVAVKRLLNVSMQGVEEFRTEVVLIAKLQHRNLVRLLGYYAKADEKILLYEFMPNGSLDCCLFDETHSV